MSFSDVVVAVLAGVGLLAALAYVKLGLGIVARDWRWWLSWFSRGLPLSKCPCCAGPTVAREGGEWVVGCEHSVEVSPTRRLARFHWERHVRLRGKWLGRHLVEKLS